MKPAESYEEMCERIQLRENESLSDILSLGDAKARYGIGRTTLREAALRNKIYSRWFGGETKKSLYLTRGDIIKYIQLPQSKVKSKLRVPWRLQDKKPKVTSNVHVPEAGAS